MKILSQYFIDFLVFNVTYLQICIIIIALIITEYYIGTFCTKLFVCRVKKKKNFHIIMK